MMRLAIGEFTVQGLSMSSVVRLLTQQLDHTVLDKTGLKGDYDFTLRYTPNETQPPGLRGPASGQQGTGNTPSPNSSGPSIFTAIQEQLGLKLEPQNVPMEILVIDHAEQPPEPQAQTTVGLSLAYVEASIKANKSEGGLPTLGGLSGYYQNVTLHTLIRVAYGVQDSQILEGPTWLNSEKYDIEAKMDKSAADEWQKLSLEQRMLDSKPLLRGLLADRFKLTLHRETRELPLYALVIAKNGPKVVQATVTGPNGPSSGPPIPDGFPVVKGGGIGLGNGRLTARAAPVSFFADILSRQPEISRTVLDKTGLNGKFDFTLQWSPDSNRNSIFAAVQEQLGLKLEAQTGPVEVLVIDHAEQPLEN